MLHEETTKDIIGAAMAVSNITGLDVAILLNFKNARLEWKRIINERRKAASGQACT